VPPARWGCKPHWFKLPKEIQRRIWLAYEPGQEDRLDPSAEYLVVAREAQDWIAANHPPAAERTVDPTDRLPFPDGDTA
jgi:hypothetical protein